MENKEVWKYAVGFDNWYEVSNKGRVRTYRTKSKGNKRAEKPKIIDCYLNPIGYWYAKLKKGKVRSGYLVHRLVAEAFITNPENKPQVNHIDGIKSNNDLSNLEWCTAKENTKHAFDTNLRSVLYGEDVGNSKLIRNDVLQIRSVWGQGWFSCKEIALAYNVSQRQIQRIVKNQRWGHL